MKIINSNWYCMCERLYFLPTIRWDRMTRKSATIGIVWLRWEVFIWIEWR